MRRETKNQTGARGLGCADSRRSKTKRRQVVVTVQLRLPVRQASRALRVIGYRAEASVDKPAGS